MVESNRLPKRGVELADVVRRFGPKYTTRYAGRMMPSQRKALADIAACCTEELGGRRYRCDDCRESFWRYHACRNRACPKCQGSRTEQWLQQRQAELLPCGYFHAVTTVPSELRDAFRRDQKFMYGLLMRVSAEAVKELCAKKRYLGGLPGILSVLHTWNGQLGYHPHVHMLITGGGISPDGQHWEPARNEYLLPVAVLSKKVAAKFRDAVRAERPELFKTIPGQTWKREWVSFVKHYGHGNEAVLNYLSRYVLRVAITNARILAVDQAHVTFRWKDRGADTWRTTRLEGVEFLRRFLQHVLPQGFHKVRYYGLWHHSRRKLANRAWLLLVLQQPTDLQRPMKIADLIEAIGRLTLFDQQEDISPETEATDRPCCPYCGSLQTTLLAERPPPGSFR
jgi:Putative transposase/Transposase zinc-binding domain